MKFSERGRAMLTNFEAMVLHVYKDQVGIPTVCVGHVVRPEDHAWIDDGVSREECQETLAHDVGWCEAAVNKVTVPLSQDQYDSLISLVFNIGAGNFAHSTLLAKLNAGDYHGAADEFPKWKNARVGGVLKPILLGRRLAEQALFLTGIAHDEAPTLEQLLAVAQSQQFDLVGELNLAEPLNRHTEPPPEPEPIDQRITLPDVALPPKDEEPT